MKLNSMGIVALWRCILALCAGMGAYGVLGATQSPAENQPTREDRQKSPSEDRQTKSKERRDRLQNLTPEQREVVRKTWRERIEKRIAELRQKETDGSITEAERKQLEQWEKRLKLWDQRTAPAQPGDNPGEDKPPPKKPPQDAGPR